MKNVLIVIDETMKKSWKFSDSEEGFQAAAAQINAIIGQGHKVGGDVARIRAYTG